MAATALAAIGACQQTPAPAQPPAPALPATGQVVPVAPNPSPPPVSAPPAASEAQAVPTPPEPPAAAAPPPTTSAAKPAPRKAAPAKPAQAGAGAPAAKPTTGTTAASAAVEPTPAVHAAAAAQPAPKPAAPALDLASLEQRLRDTKAIGVFTKLSLKNQVDDLLDEVRQYHRNPANPPQPVVRQHFEGLMLKVLSSLQGGDPQLANTIASSREALWGILIDPVKFSKI